MPARVFPFLIVSVCLLNAGCSRATVAAQAGTTTAVERGRYLVDAVGCHDCHTPKKMGPNGPEADTTKLLAGYLPSEPLPAPPPVQQGPWIATGTWDLTAWSGPWGVSYAINLTPDNETGLGHWDGGHVPDMPGAENREAHGKVTADPSADALAGVPQFFGLRSEGDVRLLADRACRQQSSPRSGVRHALSVTRCDIVNQAILDGLQPGTTGGREE